MSELNELRKAIVDACYDINTSADIDDVAAERVAAAILTEGWVRLPRIGEQDDIGHWQGLSDQQLQSETWCDLWNAAAGIREQQRRAARLAHDAAVFAYRQVAS